MLDRPTHREQFTWTDAHVELLTILWSEGKSGHECATIIGCGLTRNAVIGKVHRLKLPKRLSQSPYANEHVRHIPKPRQPRVRKPKALKFGVVRKMPEFEPDPVPAIGAWEPLPGTVPVPLIDLSGDACRWPIGEPLVGFCGCRAMEGRPYCAAHYARSIGKGTVSERTAVHSALNVAKHEEEMAV